MLQLLYEEHNSRTLSFDRRPCQWLKIRELEILILSIILKIEGFVNLYLNI